MSRNNSSQPFRPPEDQNYRIWGGPGGGDQGGSFNLASPQQTDLRNHQKAYVGFSIQVTSTTNSTTSFEQNIQNPFFEIQVMTSTRVWKVLRRYSDFVVFHQQLPESNLIFGLPPLQGGNDASSLLTTYLEQVSTIPIVRQSKVFCDFLDDNAGVIILQAEVQNLIEEKKALQNEVSEVRGLLSACTQTIQQQGKALMLFEKRLAAMDANNNNNNNNNNSNRSSHERRKSWGTTRTSHDGTSRESDPDRSSYNSRASSDGFEEYYQDCSPDGSPRNITPTTFPPCSFFIEIKHLEPIPDLVFSSPSFSLNNHADELVALLTPSYPSNKHRQRVVKFVANHIRKSLGATSLCLGSFAERTYLPDQPVDMSCFLCRGQETSWFIRVNEALCRLSGESKPGDSMRISNVNFVNHTQDDVKYLLCTVNNVAVTMSANQLGGLCLASFVEEVDILLGEDHLLKRSLLLVKAWWLYESAPEGSRNNLNAYFPEDALTVMVMALFNPPKSQPTSPEGPSSSSSSLPNSPSKSLPHHVAPNTPLEALALFFKTYMPVDWSKTCITITGLRDIYSTAPEPQSTLIPHSLLVKYRHSFKLKPISAPVSPPRRRQSKTNGGNDVIVEEEPTLEEDNEEDFSKPSSSSSAAVESSFVLGELSESILDEVIGDDNEFDVREMNVAHPLDPYQNLIPFHKLDGKRMLRTRSAMISASVKLAEILRLSANGHHDEASLSLDNMFSHSWARFGSGWRPDLNTLRESSSSNNELRTSIRSENGRRASERRGSEPGSGGGGGALRRGSDRRGSERRGSVRDSIQSSASYEDSDDSDGEDALSMDCLSMGSDILWKQVEYCRLLLEVEVTEPALRTLAAEILTDKGPLPVGEIGKLLQEITANSNLSTILKDKFGGLKKFLEKFEQDFFVSNDHPFNPHVHLRSELTEEQIQLLLSGQVVTTPTAAPSRRSKKAARRKNNMLAPVNTTGTTVVHPGSSNSPPPPPSPSSTTIAPKVDQSRFTNLFMSQNELSEAVSPRNPNAPVFIPRNLPGLPSL